MKKLLIISLLFVLFSCEKFDWSEDGNTFIIPKGSHYAEGTEFSLESFNGDGIKMSALFDESARYIINDVDSLDWNKLIGFAEDIRFQENSARIGWRWSEPKQKIELGYYCYVKGEINMGWLYDVQIGAPFRFIVTDDQEKKHYLIDIEGNYKAIPHKRNNDNKKYWLRPYFGGDKTAPHDIKIVFGTYFIK